MKKIIALLSVAVLLFAGAFVISENNTVLSGTRAEAAEYKSVQALHILVPSEKQALEIRNEIMQGKTQEEIFRNFMNAAKKYSKCPSGANGGILGWFKRGDMVKPFEDTAFNLQPGVVSEPVKTDFGWHLIYVISKK